MLLTQQLGKESTKYDFVLLIIFLNKIIFRNADTPGYPVN